MNKSVDQQARVSPDRTQSQRTGWRLAVFRMLQPLLALTFGLVALPVAASAQISVSPSYDAIGNTGPNPYTFTITNSGTRSTTALPQVSCSGAVTSCSSSASSVFVGANGGQSTVTVSYTTSGNSTGSFTLTATDKLTQQTAQGTVNVTMPNAQPSVTASTSTAYTAENYNTSGLQFTITNTGNTAAQYTLTPNCAGNLSGCSISSPTGSLSHNQSATVSIDFTPGAATGGNGTIALTATGPASIGSQTSTSPTVTVVPLSEAVQVTPDGATATLDTNITVSVPFTVHETGNASTGFNYTLTSSCSGTIVGCTFVSTGTNTMTVGPAPGVDQTVQVTLRGTSNYAGGYGAVSVIASYNNGVNPTYQDEGSYGTTIPDRRSYNVSVSPTSSTVYNESNVHTNVTFTLTNSGNTQGTYTVTTPTCSGTATGCSFSSGSSVTSTSVTVNPHGGTASVPVYFTTGSVGQNVSATLHAVGASNSADGTITLVTQAPTVRVDGGSTGSAQTNSSGTTSFNVHNGGNAGTVTYNLQVTGCSPLMTCTAPGSVTVAQGADATVQVSYQALGTGGVDSVTLHATAPQPPFVNVYQGAGTNAITVTSRLGVSLPFMNNTDQNVGLCAANCFAVATARSTVPYYSLNQPRSVTLAYNSDRAFPRPFVHADVSVANAPASVSEYRLEVQRNGADLTFTNGETVLHFQGTSTPATTYRLAGQVDLTSFSTGMYPVTVVVTAIYSNGASDQTGFPTQLMVVNAGSSPVAKGWTVAGIPRLYMQSDSSALIVDGTGSGEYFAKSSIAYSGYVSPTSEYSATLAPRPYGAGWVHTALDSTKIWFNSAGLADSVTDRFGISTRFQYDGSQRLVRVYDSTLVRSAGSTRAVTTLNYGSAGLSSIVEANPVAAGGRSTVIHIDANGMLRAVVDPDNDSTSYSYDSRNRLSSIRDRNGIAMTYAYDSTWKVASVSAPLVATDTGNGSVTPRTPITHFTAWQSVGVPGSATAITHAALLGTDTLSARTIDPLGHITTFVPDLWGQPLKVTDPLGNVTTITRANGPLATHVLYPDSTTDDFGYGPTPLVAWALHTGQDTVHYYYGAAGQLSQVTGSGVVGETLTLEAGTGRVITVKYGSNPADTTHYTYDPVTKQVASVRTPDGAMTSYQYDSVFGNLAVTTAPGGRVTTVVFDAYGRDSTVTAPQTPTQTTLYDIVNRPVSLYDGVAGTPIRVGYSGDLAVSVRDQAGQVDSTEYDALGRAVRHFGFASSTIPDSVRYDLDSRPTSMTNRRGQRMNLTYDALDRVLTKSDNTTTDVITFSYSPNGLTQTAVNAADTVNIVSSPSSRSETVQTTLGGHTYTVVHNFTARADGTDSTSIASNGGVAVFKTRAYIHDAVTGGLAGIRIGVGATSTTSFGYNDAAQRTATTWAGAVPGSATYLTTGGYARQTYGVLGSALDNAFDVQYVADSAERILRDHRKNAAGTADVNRIFGYDALGRFTGVTDASAHSWSCGGSGQFDPDYGDVGCPIDTVTTIKSYAYDNIGNRSTTFLSGTQYVGDRLQQLPYQTPSGSVAYYSYTYDGDGNVHTKSKTGTNEVWTYTWSPDGHLTGVTHSVAGVSDDSVTYGYDAFGQPVKKSRGGALERLSLYDVGHLVADLAPDGSRLAEYVYDAGTDTPHAVLTGADTVTNTEYVAQDAFGNVTGTFTADSTAQERATYGDWGAPSVIGTSSNRLFWKGLAYDSDAGLYYVRARWYDPDAGRFVSEDPAGLPGGVNPYVFAANDPVNGADPTGMWIQPVHVIGQADPNPTSSDTIGTGGPGWTPPVYGGGPDGPTGGTARSQPKPKKINPNAPYPYKPLKRCQPFLTRGFTGSTLQATWNTSMSMPGHPEAGGYIYAIGSTSTLAVDPAKVGQQSSLLLPTPVPFNVNLWFHSHPNWGGLWAQGPSGQDVITTMALHVPAAIISHDSLFFVTADGHATGCAR